MKANELRIGNWIKDRGGKEWQIDFWESKNKVSAKEPEFNTNGIILIGHPLTEYVDYLQPIPLTEELLLKCVGLKKLDKYTFFIHGIFIHKIKAGFIFNLGKRKIKIDFLHNFQNLIHSLTGRELKIEQ